MAGNLIQPFSNTGAGSTLINPYLPTSQVSFQFWQKPVYQATDGTYWTPGFEGPTYMTSPWDYLYLGIPSTTPFTPGKCIVRPVKFRDVDKKKAAGNDGGRITVHGIEPAEVDIEIIIWTPEQLRQLANLWPILFPQAYKGSPVPYDTQHPTLTIHNIKSLIFVRGEGPTIDDQRRGHFTIKAWEFLKPAATKGKATATASLGSLLDPGAYPTPGSNANNLGPR